MEIDRRQFAVPVLAIGLSIPALGVIPAFAGADEDAVAKNVEAFRAAQFAADAKTLEGLCAPELSYSHSDGRVEDKAAFVSNATDGKTKFLSLAYQDVWSALQRSCGSTGSAKVRPPRMARKAPLISTF